MTSNERSRRVGPPYVAHRTWETLLAQLRQESDPVMPRRLDSSVWARWGFSGSNQSALKGALLFLGLTTEDYEPTPRLEALVAAYGNDDERRGVIYQLVADHYIPILPGIDLARTTRQEIRGAFRSAGSGTQTSDKAVTFFVALARDSGRFELSSQLRVRTRGRRSRQNAYETPSTEKSINTYSENDTEKRHPAPPVAQTFGTEKVIHPMLRALVDELPAQGEQWPVAKKHMFERVWSATFAYLYGGSESNDVVT